MLTQWWTWLRALLRSEPIPPAPALEQAVLGVVLEPPRVREMPAAVLSFRGRVWHITGQDEQCAVFGYETAVQGRAVSDEVRVQWADLEEGAPGHYTIRGR